METVGLIFTVLLIVLAIILVLVGLILVCPLSVLFSVGETELMLRVKVLGIRFRIPLGEKKDKPKKEKNVTEKKEPKAEDRESVMKKFLEMRNTFTRIREALGKTLSYLSRKIRILQLAVMGTFGLGDAALTGMSYGAVEAFTGVVTGFLQHFLVFEKPVYYKLDMDYDNVVFKLQFAMEVKTKPWYLVRGALIFYKNFKQS